MRTWSKSLWAIFISLIALITLLVFEVSSSYKYSMGMYMYLIKVSLSEAVFFGSITLALGIKYNYHFHHYLIAMCCIPLVCIQNYAVCFIHGYLVGMMVEGGARWGYDAVWTRIEDNNENTDSDSLICENTADLEIFTFKSATTA